MQKRRVYNKPAYIERAPDESSSALVRSVSFFIADGSARVKTSQDAQTPCKKALGNVSALAI